MQVNATPHLLLHFDVNKTLVLMDSSKGVGPEEMISSLLAEFTVGKWDCTHDKMTYLEYIDRVLQPKSREDRQALIRNFLQWLEATHHGLKEQVFEERDRIRLKLQDQKFSVFQSFYTLISTLKEKQVRFTVLLRTFGDDLREVVDEISAHPQGVTISQKARFVSEILHFEGSKSVRSVDAIFQTFLESQEHFAVQDNWKEWAGDDKRARSGKPFMYDASGSWHGISNLSLFFDDNCTCQEFDIVHPVEISGNHSPSHELKDQFLFTVNPLEAVLDDDYYVKLVNQAISKFSLHKAAMF